MNLEFQVTGLDELRRRLNELPGKLQRRVLKDAVKDAAQLIQKAAQEKAPVAAEIIFRQAIRKTGKRAGSKYRSRILPGTLKKSITVRQNRKAARRQIIFQIGPSKRAFYGQFVERGHVLRRKAKGEVVGHVPAMPFMRPAIEENAQKAIDVMRRRLSVGLDQVVEGK